MPITYTPPAGQTILGPHKELANLPSTRPAIQGAQGGDTYTFTYTAPHPVLLQHLPTWGGEWPTEEGNYPEDYYISDFSLTPTGKGDLATLTVTLAPAAASTGTEGREDAPTYALEVAQLEKPIEAHPRYNGLDTGPTYTTNLQTEVTLLAWIDEEAGTVDTDPSTDPDDTALLGEIWEIMKRQDLRSRRRLYRRLPTAALGIIDELLSKRAKGTEQYLVFYPVATVRKRSHAIPTVQSFGLRTTDEPFSGVPEDYEWLKTGGTYQRAGRTGPYDSEEKSIGAQPWDEELYDEAP